MEIITIPIDAETKRRLEQQARAQGLPLEAWVAEALRRAAQAEWPEAVRQLVGAWGDDFSDPDVLRRSLEDDAKQYS